MGYALFANRKIYLTNLIFTLQSQLDNIMMQRQKIINFSANIADGVVTVDEMASDPTNYNNYSEFVQQRDAFRSLPDSEGGAGTVYGQIGAVAENQNNSDAYLMSIDNILKNSIDQEFANQYNKKVEAFENQLDMQQKRIETKLSAAEKQLEAVEEAEGAAIDRATPKFNGVG